MAVRFFRHHERVVRITDGRTGQVKDIEGLAVNVVWDDDGTLQWQQVEALVPR